MAANFMVELRAMGYNVCTSFEGDESPDIGDEQPREAEGQLDEDLMRDLERQQSSPSH